MKSKVLAVFALLGFVWMLYLFFNAADLEYTGQRYEEKHLKIRCVSLGEVGFMGRNVSGRGLPAGSVNDISDFVDQAKRDGEDNPDRYRAELEQTVVADCQTARTNRLTLLMLVTTITSVLTISSLLLRRPRTRIEHIAGKVFQS
ncbi:hypothetical protein AB0E69_10620 [Kribbella sp. NPDC026611]|uniref:hypothetical protein n=1 Tax=Kribbella sp. NPDC026611 TaxID=3154911 RepID=UPI0033E06B10